MTFDQVRGAAGQYVTLYAVKRAYLDYGWRVIAFWRRYRLAAAYATNTLTQEQAQRMLPDIEDAACSWPLESITANAVYEDALARWSDHPELERLAEEAADCVAQNWCGDQITESACGWALQIIKEYADCDGIELVECE